ncbi:TlpA family protein disulfide reductase [Lignipirellula cremea]|uniref:Thiol-disulfide oxidoreductase ResA n=1 Tax=Lignipirellula cremea TaxID=2528010 RepID=A0A518DSN8_9BACT|nr:TlpA disulfide reductase family protein [Lignipirellula cremea]QDU94855.1 Thiol-disulfide oxidoreductase ResA [Lignipirellula cremea]
MFRKSCWMVMVATFLTLPCLQAAAQDGTSKVLPQDPSQWINSNPISADTLQGKAALLWYFEEDCPRCRAKWPALIALSKSFVGKPIVFIAVNSGNSRQAVEQYARSVRLPWPIIVDPTRQFEKASNLTEISLQNIHQVKLIMPDGRMRNGDWNDLKASADSALSGAKWNVDPSEISPGLMPAWQSIEFGDFAGGSSLVARNLKSRDEAAQASAAKLQAYVDSRMQQMLAAGNGASDNWSKYKTYLQISEQFDGYDLPEEVTSGLAQLADDPAVKDQLAAYKQLLPIKKSLQSSNRSVLFGAVKRLKTLVESSPGTDAALEAQNLLQQLGQ